MTKVLGVVSDTHVPERGYRLPPDLLLKLQGVDQILHAGDLSQLRVLEVLGKIAPVTAVRGNVDLPEVKVELNAREIVEVGRALIGLVHGDGITRSTRWRAEHAFGSPPADAAGRPLAAIIYGHSHEPYCQVHEGVLYLNPGSPTDPRWGARPSFGMLRVEDDGSVVGEIVLL